MVDFDQDCIAEILARLERTENRIGETDSPGSQVCRPVRETYPCGDQRASIAPSAVTESPAQRWQDRGSGDDDADKDRFLGAPEVEARYRISSMTLWRWLRDRELGFPRPTWIRKRRYWRHVDLVTWERTRASRNLTRNW